MINYGEVPKMICSVGKSSEYSKVIPNNHNSHLIYSVINTIHDQDVSFAFTSRSKSRNQSCSQGHLVKAGVGVE